MVSVQKINLQPSKIKFGNLVDQSKMNSPISAQSNSSLSSLVSSSSPYSTSASAPQSSPNVNTDLNNASNNKSPVSNSSANAELKTAKTISYVSAGVALASLGVTLYNARRGKFDEGSFLGKVKNEIGELVKEGVKQGVKSVEEKVSGVENKLNEKVAFYDGQFDGIYSKSENENKFFTGWFRSLESKVGSASNTILEKNLMHIDGFKLLQNLDNDGKRIPVSQNVVKEIRGMAQKYISGVDVPQTEKLNKNSSIWSITAEGKPEKEGGLGEVPTQIAANFTKELGIKNNYEILPLYEIPGKSRLVEVDGKFNYFFGDLNKPEMNLAKVVEFDMPAFRKGRLETQKIEVYFGEKDGIQKLYFKNSDYFKGPGQYRNTQNAAEKEKFGFFSKAVYDFAKLTADPASATSYKIFDDEVFKSIKAPDAMILNDWHAAPMAPLMRYLSLLESCSGELDSNVAKKFSKINMIDIIHNGDYQGAEYENSSEILNTLFGKYSADVYEHALTGFDNPNLWNTLKIDNSVNMANMALSLANKVKPVSKTYGLAMGEQVERSRGLQHIVQARIKAGTLEGASNGWDRAENEVSLAKIGGYNQQINRDILEVVKAKCLGLSGLNTTQRESINAIFSDKKTVYNALNFNQKIHNLRDLDIPELTKTLDELAQQNMLKLRQLKTFTYTNSDTDILAAKIQHKQSLIEHLNSMISYDKANKTNLFKIMDIDNTDLSHITPEELAETPVINMVARFVSQKGIDVSVDSIKAIMKDWDVKYPGKKKPIFVIGGADAEGGRIKQMALDMKKALGQDGKQVVYIDGFAPSNIFQSGSDLTMYSSHFEPDGSKWESLNKGVPALCTRVDGHVDSIQDGVNGYLTKRTIPEINAELAKRNIYPDSYDYHTEKTKLMTEDFIEIMHKGIQDFYAKEPAQKMMRNAINGDQSWLIKDDKGNIVGGALLGHMKDLGFDLNEFNNIKLA